MKHRHFYILEIDNSKDYKGVYIWLADQEKAYDAISQTEGPKVIGVWNEKHEKEIRAFLVKLKKKNREYKKTNPKL